MGAKSQLLPGGQLSPGVTYPAGALCLSHTCRCRATANGTASFPTEPPHSTELKAAGR